MTSAIHGALYRNHPVASFVIVPIAMKTVMNPAETARLTASARCIELSGLEVRVLSMPRK